MRAAQLNRGSLSGTPCIEAAGEIGGTWSLVQAVDEPTGLLRPAMELALQRLWLEQDAARFFSVIER